ncbi:two-component sensor histidine kinase [Paractinoplanes deccanensis]|uniref:histidine kinase n=1 Tax=Paractinoplanes deccanensis TaxID=113561 RepID=A0ABQ3YE93_9ACTN|nr:histidine kinase [Actinoplanes deccanensis]GID78314.1 two-component sensor histidine kinase [Actinoplanes deccanensis]
MTPTLGPRVRPLVPGLAWLADLVLWLAEGAATPVAVPLLSALVCATLFARAAHPVAVLAVHLGWSVCVAQIWHASPLVGLLVALYAVAAGRSLRLSVCGMLLTAAALAAQLEIWSEPLESALFELLAVALAAGGAWALGRRNITLRAEAAAAALRVERLRIARDLHDIVSHALSGIVVQAAGAKAVLSLDPGLAERGLSAIESTGAQAMDEMHRMLGLLRSAGGDDATWLNRQPGLANVGALLDWARDNGLVPTTVVDGEPGRLDDSTSLAAYRVVQEALTNTLKHAGPGTAVTLRLSWGDTDLTVSVENHLGRPLRAGGRLRQGGGYGLTGLRERVTTVGGAFESRALDDGFLVSARLPLARRLDREPVGGPVR